VTSFRPARFLGVLILTATSPALAGPPRNAENPSPIALSLSADGGRLVVANQGTGTVALIDPKGGKLIAGTTTGEKPAGVALSADGRIAVVSHWYGSDVAILEVGADRLAVIGRVEVGPEPRGIALSQDKKTAYVALGASNEVVRIDLAGKRVSGRLTVGREPRGLAIDASGARLVTGDARSESLTIVDLAAWKVERTLPIACSNLRQVAFGPDGKEAYVACMQNRGMATTESNIDLGWVLGQRLARVRIDGKTPVEVVSLDPKGKAVGDVHGVAISRDGKRIAVSAGGTHEVLLLRAEPSPLPWRERVGRDLIPPELLKQDGRFRRVATGGRPTELAFSPDGSTVYAANYLGDSIQAIDFDTATLAQTIDLGAPKSVSLVRRGETLFHDATRSSNQWYSCNTCHSDGHTNGLDFDTMNDGWHDYSTAHLLSRKKVPTLRRVAMTGPWTWHGWQTSLTDATVESFTKSMQGKRPTLDDAKAVVAFLNDSLPQRRAVKPSSARPKPPAPPATAVRNSPTARSTKSASKIVATSIEDLTPRRSGASTTRTLTSTTAGPRPFATPSLVPTIPKTSAVRPSAAKNSTT
jgi:DNA-binding beta-propeller fold protein YncE